MRGQADVDAFGEDEHIEYVSMLIQFHLLSAFPGLHTMLNGRELRAMNTINSGHYLIPNLFVVVLYGFDRILGRLRVGRLEDLLFGGLVVEVVGNHVPIEALGRFVLDTVVVANFRFERRG